MVGTYSFTPEELAEAEMAGLSGSDELFDDAIAEIHLSHVQLLQLDETRLPTE